MKMYGRSKQHVDYILDIGESFHSYVNYIEKSSVGLFLFRRKIMKLYDHTHSDPHRV